MKVTTITDMVKDKLYNIISKSVLLYHKILDRLRGKPDVIIVGEVHIDPYHAETQAKLIEYYRPKYVLLEFSPEEHKELVEAINKHLKDRSIGSFIKRNNIPLDIILNTFGRLKPKIKEIKREAMEELKNKKLYAGMANIIPENLEELLNAPIYKISPKFLERFKKTLEEEIQAISIKDAGKGDISSSSLYYLLSYLMLYDYINFNYYLTQQLIKEDILAKANIYKWIVVSAAESVGSNVGSFDDDISTKYMSLSNEEAWKRRERTMGENIIKYLKEAGGSIIVITGLRHTDRDSEMIKVLKENGIKIRIIRLPVLQFAYNSDDKKKYELSVIAYAKTILKNSYTA